MSDWHWVDQQALLLLHEESLAEHRGTSGLRDRGLLESALARPHNLVVYGDPDVSELAAAYGFGLAKNHAFVDGNKWAPFLAVGLFLALNGRRLTASQVEATLTMLDVAAGAVDESALSNWIRTHSAPRSGRSG